VATPATVARKESRKFDLPSYCLRDMGAQQPRYMFPVECTLTSYGAKYDDNTELYICLTCKEADNMSLDHLAEHEATERHKESTKRAYNRMIKHLQPWLS
jgi:hypothetical protein